MARQQFSVPKPQGPLIAPTWAASPVSSPCGHATSHLVKAAHLQAQETGLLGSSLRLLPKGCILAACAADIEVQDSVTSQWHMKIGIGDHVSSR